VAYYLMADNRRRVASSGYLTQEMTEASTQCMNPTGVMQQPNASGSQTSLPQQRVIAERRWRLGVHSRQHPSTIMAELYRSLQSLSIAWKKVTPYCVRGRYVYQNLEHPSSMEDMAAAELEGTEPQLAPVVSSPRLIKLEVQVYKSRDGECLLDIQRLHGDLFLFIDLCWRLLGELRITA